METTADIGHILLVRPGYRAFAPCRHRIAYYGARHLSCYQFFGLSGDLAQVHFILLCLLVRPLAWASF